MPDVGRSRYALALESLEGAVSGVEAKVSDSNDSLDKIFVLLDTLTTHVVSIDNRNDEFHKALLGKLNTIIRQLSHKLGSDS